MRLPIALVALLLLLRPSLALAERQHEALVRVGAARSSGPFLGEGTVVGLAYRLGLPRFDLELGVQAEMMRADERPIPKLAGGFPRLLLGIPVLGGGAFGGDLRLRLFGGAGYGRAVVFRPAGSIDNAEPYTAFGAQLELGLAIDWRGAGALGYGLELGARVPLYEVPLVEDGTRSERATMIYADLVVSAGRPRDTRAGRSYRHELLVADATLIAAGLVLFEGEVDVLAPTALWFSAYLAAGPAMHALHDRPRAARRSALVRLAAPVAGALLGLAFVELVTGPEPDLPYFRHVVGAAIGAGGGVLTAVAIDALVLAF